MNFFKKKIKLIGFIILLGLASIGLGINAAILPTFRREDKTHAQTEMTQRENSDDEEHEEEQKK